MRDATLGAEVSKPNELLDILDQYADIVATMTGIKAQYIEAGWSALHAEAMVIEGLRLWVATSAGAK